MVTQAELRNRQQQFRSIQSSPSGANVSSTPGPAPQTSPQGPAPIPKTPEELRGIGREITFAEKQVFLAQKDIAELQGRAGRKGQDPSAYQARIEQKMRGLEAAQAELDRLTGRLTSQGVNIDQARSAAPKNIRAAPREDSRTGINSIYDGGPRGATGIRVSPAVVQDSRTGEYIVDRGLRPGVYGNVIVQGGARATTAGQLVRNLQGGVYRPARQDPVQLRDKSITVLNRDNTLGGQDEFANRSLNRYDILSSGSSNRVLRDQVPATAQEIRNQKRLEAIERRAQNILNEQSAFFEGSKFQSFKSSVDKLSSVLTGGASIRAPNGITGRRSLLSQLEITPTPVDERSLIGGGAQKIVEGLFLMPVTIPTTAYFGSRTLGVGASAAILPDPLSLPGGQASGARANIIDEAFISPRSQVPLGIGGRAGGQVEAGPFSFVPGGTPINQEGVATLGTALIFGAFDAAGAPGRGSRGQTIVTETVPRTEVSGVVFEARSVDIGGLTAQSRGAVVPYQTGGPLATEVPFFRGNPTSGTVPGAVRTSELSGLPILRTVEGADALPVDVFLVRIQTKGLKTEGPISNSPTTLPSDVLGIRTDIKPDTTILQLTARQAESLLPPIAGDIRAGTVQPLKIMDISPGSSPKGTQQTVAVSGQIDFFGVPKTAPDVGGVRPQRFAFDLKQLGFEIKKLETNVKAPQILERLRAFDDAAGDFFQINKQTGEFLLIRGTEARRFSRGTGSIPPRPTISLGVLPEAIATQKNLPSALLESFLQTPKGRAFTKQAAGIEIFTPKPVKVKAGSRPMVLFAAAEELPPGGTMTSDGQVLLQEPVVETAPLLQETVTEQKAEQKQKEKNIAGGKKARLTISEAASSSGRFPRQASIVLERGGNRITINEAMLRGGRFKRRILPLLSQTASTAPVQKTEESLLSSEATTQDSLIAQDSLQAQSAAQAQNQSSLVRDLLIARNAQLFDQTTARGSNRNLLRQQRTVPTPSQKPSKLSDSQKQKLTQAFDVLVRRGGLDQVVGRKLTRQEALALGAGIAKNTLAAQFAIKESGGLIPDRKGPRVDLTGFRDYKIKKGQRIKLRDRFIQEQRERLGTRGERSAIVAAKAKNSFFGGQPKRRKRGIL